jgi:hypothetical protein
MRLPNLSWVTEHLAVGGSLADAHIPHLAQELQVRWVVDLRAEAQDDAALLSRHGMTLLHLPTADLCAIAAPHLDDGVGWAASRVQRGERVYIHCEHGIGRSVLLCMCVLVHCGERALDALARIKAARPLASPSPVQLEAFVSWCTRRGVSAPEWDALAAVAYGTAR